MSCWKQDNPGDADCPCASGTKLCANCTDFYPNDIYLTTSLGTRTLSWVAGVGWRLITAVSVSGVCGGCAAAPGCSGSSVGTYDVTVNYTVACPTTAGGPLVLTMTALGDMRCGPQTPPFTFYYSGGSCTACNLAGDPTYGDFFRGTVTLPSCGPISFSGTLPSLWRGVFVPSRTLTAIETGSYTLLQ